MADFYLPPPSICANVLINLHILCIINVYIVHFRHTHSKYRKARIHDDDDDDDNGDEKFSKR
ncbi:hypothetical protein DERF_015845 [Dermatophagoides farinae]|uniref:Uncharacterized protein n=1 Tax=Dermatophagoides farinae TaxID=6954 RepID=A0A922L0Q0_DERFA|nr:hypothetical protein DERF_015845 [Dermatophagoides farinae]